MLNFAHISVQINNLRVLGIKERIVGFEGGLIPFHLVQSATFMFSNNVGLLAKPSYKIINIQNLPVDIHVGYTVDTKVSLYLTTHLFFADTGILLNENNTTKLL